MYAQEIYKKKQQNHNNIHHSLQDTSCFANPKRSAPQIKQNDSTAQLHLVDDEIQDTDDVFIRPRSIVRVPHGRDYSVRLSRRGRSAPL